MPPCLSRQQNRTGMPLGAGGAGFYCLPYVPSAIRGLAPQFEC
jgi:hypothetical protein